MEQDAPPDMPAPLPAPRTAGRGRLWRKLPALVMLAVALVVAVWFREEFGYAALARHRAELMAIRDAHYALGVALFLLAYVGIVAFSLPGATVASLTGGFLFGLFPGVIYNLGAASLGAMLLFLAVRAGFGEAVARRIEGQGGRIAWARAALARSEWEVLFLMRVTPVVPFFVANLLPAVLNISFVKFAVTTVLGILPGALLLTAAGAGLGEAVAAGSFAELIAVVRPEVALPVLGLVGLGMAPFLLRLWRGWRGRKRRG